MTPEYAIIHCSATKDSGTVSWPAIRRYHTGRLGWSDVGYHFGCEIVHDEFEILAGRPLSRMGAHCKAGGMNSRSIGFCFVGDFEIDPPPPEQLLMGARYVAGLCKVLRIPIDKVMGHRDFDKRKTCPGTMFDMYNFRRLVKEFMT